MADDEVDLGLVGSDPDPGDGAASADQQAVPRRRWGPSSRRAVPVIAFLCGVLLAASWPLVSGMVPVPRAKIDMQEIPSGGENWSGDWGIWLENTGSVPVTVLGAQYAGSDAGIVFRDGSTLAPNQSGYAELSFNRIGTCPPLGGDVVLTVQTPGLPPYQTNVGRITLASPVCEPPQLLAQFVSLDLAPGSSDELLLRIELRVNDEVRPMYDEQGKPVPASRIRLLGGRAIVLWSKDSPVNDATTPEGMLTTRFRMIPCDQDPPTSSKVRVSAVFGAAGMSTEISAWIDLGNTALERYRQLHQQRCG